MKPGQRIVIATLGSLGDLHPYMALALGLQARGYRPVVAAPPMYRVQVEAAGLRFAPLGPEMPGDDQEMYARILHPRKGLEFIFREMFLPGARRTYAELLALVSEEDTPALLVSTPVVFAVPLLAEKTGLPWISTVLAPIAFFAADEPPVLPGLPAVLTRGPSFARPWWGRGVRAAARWATRSWDEPLRELRRELELPPTTRNPIYEGQHSPHLVLAMFSPVLGSPRPDWPARARQTGFAFYDRDETASGQLEPALSRFLDDGPPPVVFTLGSTVVNAAGDFYRVSVAAAVKLGVRALLLVGKNTRNRAGLPDPLPEGVAVFDYAPYAAVFARAAAVVHQGGVGTTAQVLRAGRPMLIVPFNFDQPDNAARMARLGVGRVLQPSRYTVPRVTAALREILGDAILHQKVHAVAEILAGEDGVAAACEAIEQTF